MTLQKLKEYFTVDQELGKFSSKEEAIEKRFLAEQDEGYICERRA